ncbi:winged helix-turn-helix domain-containing protein [Streptomyces sannanensis]|uniref:ArsR/SmtB family transcription factor n=1 Tax=Streptomyces sannanensis TaxID=285536 RepID=UPI0031E961A5
MLRIHFTEVDLARLRLANAPDALWETILSFHRLRDRRGAVVFGEWRTEVRSQLNGETRLLSALVPSRGYFPDFLTPVRGPHGIEAGLEKLRGTPVERLRADLGRLAGFRRLPGWVVRIAEGGAAVEPLSRLIGALRSYHRAAVDPYWLYIRARIDADRAVRGRALLDGGADELLGSLPSMLRWRPPVLEADYPVERDLHLRGRGLLLQPSWFCRRTPVAYHDPGLPPVLVYPVTRTSPHAPAVAESTPSLGRLLGHTRSAVLQAISTGCTTSELARRAGVSLASASQHAAVLREAGLVVTLRHGNAVLHTVTPLGAALLRGSAQPEVPRPGRDRSPRT